METRGNKENNGPNSKIFENSAEFVGYRLIYSMLTKSHTGNLVYLIKWCLRLFKIINY